MANMHKGVALVKLLILACITHSTGVPYYGRLIGNLNTHAHSAAGTVYAADARTIVIPNFTYDGMGPDAFVWIGTTNSPDGTGVIVPIVPGSENKLGLYEIEQLVVKLPGSYTIADYKWISIWCRLAGANFADVYIDASFANPAEKNLGPLTNRAHAVQASQVKIIDSMTIQFTNLYYDGNGPDAYFWGDSEAVPTTQGTKLIWKDWLNNAGMNQVLTGAFAGVEKIVRMPAGKTIYDFKSFGLWCVLARQNFGEVVFDPTSFYVPAVIKTLTYDNCEVLQDDKYQVRWQVDGDSILFELAGRVALDEYMGFGLSGSDVGTVMVGADVIVGWLDQGTMTPMVVDYNLQSRAQCSNGIGACPDDSLNVGGTNDASLTVERLSTANGITRISYSRKINTTDVKDKVYPLDRLVYIAWAIGPINADGRVAYHTGGRAPVNAASAGPQIMFGRAPSTCPNFKADDGGGVVLPPWEASAIEDTTEFTVEIGQSGGERGYTGITGITGWGIAWYVNGLLIPTITVKRNVTYTFTVHGGNDTEQSAKYHPFYITNDRNGGYIQKTDAEKVVTIPSHLYPNMSA